MPYFRDWVDENTYEGMPLRERLDMAIWLNWCGYRAEATRNLDVIAESIDESLEHE